RASPTAWWPPRAPRRSCSGSARARTSSPPTSRRCSSTLAAWSSWRTARSRSSPPTASSSRPSRGNRSRARRAPSPATRSRPGRAFAGAGPGLGPATLLVVVSQSGETADTLAAVEAGHEKGAPVLAVCNVVDSSIARRSSAVLYTHAGPEISVASTKAFTTQLTALYLLALHLGRQRGLVDAERGRKLLGDLVVLPHAVQDILAHDAAVARIARRYGKASDFLYLGRGVNYPVALEGALKLKEISYIHA